MSSINACIGELEEALKALADLDRRVAITAQRIGGHEGGLISKASERDTMPDDLVSRFAHNLQFFMSLNESISQTLETIDSSLGINTGAVDRPIGYDRNNLKPRRPVDHEANVDRAMDTISSHDFALSDEMKSVNIRDRNHI